MDGVIFAGLAVVFLVIGLLFVRYEKNRKKFTVPPQTGGPDYYDNDEGNGTGDGTTITKPTPDRPL